MLTLSLVGDFREISWCVRTINDAGRKICADSHEEVPLKCNGTWDGLKRGTLTCFK